MGRIGGWGVMVLALGLLLAGGPFAAAVALAADKPEKFVPGLIYAVGQKFDKSFNEGAYEAARRFKADTGVDVLEVMPQGAAQFEQAVGALVRRGATDIVAIGYFYATPLQELAPRHPNVRFTLVDAVVDRPNVQSVIFKEHEGSFLVGMLAAMAARSHKIGFVGALDIPLLRKFIVGYEEGARHADPAVEVLVNFVGSTPAAFNDPAGGSEVARSQFDRGAEVVFAGAGTSNFGVFQAAADRGRLAIGVDSNQNHLHPGTILTSMLKRIDRAVIPALTSGRDGTWKAGVRALGLAEGAVDYAVDDHNRALITPEMTERVEAARRDIIAGRIPITDVTAR